MELYFTRHGRTEWNKALRFQGSEGDSLLLPQSYVEIGELGDRLAHVHFQKIVSSPLKRAFDTAKTIDAKLDQPLEIETSDDLREMGLGTLEGQSITKMDAIYPVELNNLRHHPELYDPSAFSGETFEDAAARMVKIVQETVREAKNDDPILFVSHGASLTAAIAALLGEPVKNWRKRGGVNNNSLTILTTTTNVLPFTLKVYNDTSFLKEDTTNVSGDELI